MKLIGWYIENYFSLINAFCSLCEFMTYLQQTAVLSWNTMMVKNNWESSIRSINIFFFDSIDFFRQISFEYLYTVFEINDSILFCIVRIVVEYCPTPMMQWLTSTLVIRLIRLQKLFTIRYPVESISQCHGSTWIWIPKSIDEFANSEIAFQILFTM